MDHPQFEEREALPDELRVLDREREDETDEGLDVRERIWGDLEEEEREETRIYSESFSEIEPVKECLVTETEKLGGENESENLEIREEVETGISEEIGNYSKNWAEIESIKECLVRVLEIIGRKGKSENREIGKKVENGLDEEIGDFSVRVKLVLKLLSITDSKFRKYKNDKIWDFSENLVEIESIKECLNRVIESIGGENNGELRERMETELIEKIGDFSVGIKEISNLVTTVESKVSEYREVREKEKREKFKFLSNYFQKIKLVKECLARLPESINEEKNVDQNEETKEETETEVGKEFTAFLVETNSILNLVVLTETKLREYRERKEKEKRELESSVVSLTEENRDINTLLRVALAEKEALERSLNRLKGNSEPKRGALWGFPRVGLGFMMGTSEQFSDSSSVISDGSECEEEVESLVSTVETMMKNQRLEITQLRRSLEESRSDNERLQTLTEKEAHVISENALYIKEMEDREEILTQNVEELLREIKETEEEVARWREACELEVEAGKSVVEERDKLVLILKQELEKTKAALEIANGKLKLKEDLANAAMAAQAAGERSLQITDSRVSALNERIEELTKQLEETENKNNIRRKVRRICWPFHALKASAQVLNYQSSEFSEILMEYGNQMTKLSEQMIKIVLMCLGKDFETKFQPEFNKCHGYLRINNYSPFENSEQNKVEGLGMHTDMSCITIVNQDEIGGLQVRSKEGKWMNINPRDDTLIVNIGDLLQAWSNGKLRSSEHRVVLSKPVNRFSLAFFWCFEDEKVIVSPDEVVGDRNLRIYKPFICEDYMKFRENSERGKFEKVGFTVKDFAGTGA